MAKILYAWELGGGLGHLTNARPIIEELQRRGHQVSAAIRDRRGVDLAWAGLNLAIYDAPFKAEPTADEIHPVKLYSHILHNIGWGNPEELNPLLRVWQDIYETARPDFVIHEHCPTGLLISQKFAIPHATIGTGFCIPSADSTLRVRSKTELTSKETLATQRVETTVNAWLAANQQRSITDPLEPYERVTETLLTTYPELDHFPKRPQSNYYGIPNSPEGVRPAWPATDGPRLFAYLHADATLEAILKVLSKLEIPTLVYLGIKEPKSSLAFQSKFLRIVDQPVDLGWAAQQASIGILNGSHGSTAAFLLAGKPVLQLPIQLEQYLGARRCAEQGAALLIDRHQPSLLAPALRTLLSEPQYQAQAFAFRQKYRNWLPARQAKLIVDSIEKWL